MDKNRIKIRTIELDEITRFDEGNRIEYWFARELMRILGYERWENFEKSIKRAMESCESQGNAVEDHFREVTKMVKIGSSAKRKIKDYMLTRYACYLIAMNGDPQKEEIAFAQSYFAVQTRKQELIEERIALIERTQARDKLKESEKRLSQNIYERGVDDVGFGRIRSKGDSALFGGRTTQEMKRKLGVKDNRPLADFLPTLTIAAKNLATEMTNYNVEDKDLQAELASRAGVSRAYISSIISGKRNISARFAMALEYALDVPKSLWLNLQANYDAELLESNPLDLITDEERTVWKQR